jgi:glycosyltransferase involved in cell wall biosynthesis
MPDVLMMAQRYKPYIGGVEKHIEKVSESLRDRHYDVTVLTTKGTDSLSEFERSEPADIIRFPRAIERDPFRLARWFRSKRQLFQKFEIIHCHDVLSVMLWSPPFRLMFPSRSVFATFHGYERDPVPLRFRLVRKGAEHLIRGSICIGSFIEGAYGTHCNASPLGGVETSGRKASGENHAIYVGRLEDDTPIEGYISAVKHLVKKQRDNLAFTVCGEGSLRKRLETLCREENIPARFTGRVRDSTQHYLAADLALAGGFLSVLEAMSYGLPVIAYSGTSLKQDYYRSVLAAGGPISIQSSPAGVAKEIQRLMDSDSLRQRLSERAIDFAKMNDWNRMADLYVRLWSGSI